MNIAYIKRRKDEPRVKKTKAPDPVDGFTKRLIVSGIKKLYRKHRAEITILGLSEVEYFKRMSEKLL